MDENTKDHLANERTFLAWIRTSIGVMAFGFVVEKFALFIKQIDLLLGKSTIEHNPSGYSSIFGELLVGFGILLCLFSFIQYLQVGKKIDAKTYRPTYLLNIVLTALVIGIGIFLVIYLNNPI